MKILILGGNSYIAKKFIAHYQDKFDFTIIKRDATLKDYFDLDLKDFIGFDTVINFTAIVHQKKANESLHKKYNFTLVKHLADLAKKAKISHFIQFSTISVYGDVDAIDIDTIAKPVTAYGLFKLKADEYLQSVEDKNFIVSILRPPIVYGKDAPGNMQQLIDLAKMPFPLPFGYRENKRAILCVSNLLFALELIIEKKVSGLFLLKDKESPSIGLLVEQMQKKANIKVPQFIVNLLLKSKIGVFRKLFGNLIIDDSVSVSKIGNYYKSSWQECINKIKSI